VDVREAAAKRALAYARELQKVASESIPTVLAPLNGTKSLFDEMVTEPELREEVRQLYIDGHYSQAVEEGFKFLNNLVRRRTGSSADGAPLMTTVFSPKGPLLKLNDLKTTSQKDQQQGYMHMLEGAMIGIRNPRAHDHQHSDEPRNALELLAFCNHLVRTISSARRTRPRTRPGATPK
jgi:uncharacterized protein (TIGR02391 family)